MTPETITPEALSKITKTVTIPPEQAVQALLAAEKIAKKKQI